MITRNQKMPLAELALEYYQKHRRDLPWRDTGNPYYTWISEIMLQQTRVEAVKAYFERFIKELPDIQALADCEEEKLLKLWEGLGYYSRVRNLQKAAIQIIQDHHGELPHSKSELLALSGIGDYTASAIASIAFGEQEIAIDGNLIRVFSRVFGLGIDFSGQKAKKELAEQILPFVPQGVAGDFNQAIMDIGATICLPNGKPLCAECPFNRNCFAHAESRQMDFPLKKEKKSRKIEKRTVLIIQDKDRIILRKRMKKGVLMGLWEFPNVTGHLSKHEVIEILEGEMALPNYCIEEVATFEPAGHIFSHLEWHMISYWIKLREAETSEVAESVNRYQVADEIGGVWVSKRQMEEELSLPSAFKVYQDGVFKAL